MAEALVAIAAEKVAYFLERQLTLLLGAKDGLESLKDTFESIQAVLADAESRQVAEKRVQLWLSRLRRAAYDIDDVLNEWQVSVLEEEQEASDNRNMVSSFLQSTVACFRQNISRCKIAFQIKEIRNRLERIAADENQYNFIRSDSVVGDRTTGRSRPQTSSLIEESEIIGRNDDKRAVVDRLVGESIGDEDGQVHVIAIVGIGGLGKTTLARQVYNDDDVRQYFEKDLYWVCVSEGFDVAGLTKDITEQVKLSRPSSSQLDLLQRDLLEALRGRRFLLVLDDVWNVDARKWETLQLSLKSGAKGSKILVTSRNERVANTMNAAYIHKLQGLTDDQSWTLFSKKAFAGRGAEESEELESIGKEIVSKCKGVPLSITVMGSAMNSKKRRGDWQKILESEMWSLPQVTDEILPALLVSYYNLPAQLKQCFSYCSIHMKDEVMVKDQLVKLWAAEGFIRPQGNRDIEVIGEECFNDLVAWSMFLDVTNDEDKGTRCKMHDLLHDLAQFITREESCILTSGKSKPCSAKIRHASLFLNYGKSNRLISSSRAKKLRTLFLHEVDKIDNSLVDLFSSAKFLRVLRFTSSTIETLPKTIGKMKHLRYLDLSGSSILELPESLCHLRSLHTLNLTGCSKLERLPGGMGEMVSLRHLEIEETESLQCLPKGLGRISSLRTLCKFIVGGEGGCRIGDLQSLNSLQGSLMIEHLERILSREEANEAELCNKSDLSSLVLNLSGSYVETMVSWVRDAEIERMNGVLESLRPHANLEKLKINCCSCSKLPSWLEDSSFSKLTKLEIDGSTRCEYNLPGLGKLPALKYLQIREVGIRKIDRDIYYGSTSVASRRGLAFPKLEELILYNMNELQEWESMPEAKANAIMPSLRILKLWKCTKLEVLPHHFTKAPLTELVIEGAEKLKGTRCLSFPHLETFTLGGSSEFFSSCLPALPKLKTFVIEGIKNERLPERGWERLAALEVLRISYCVELKYLPDGLTKLQSLENLIISGCEKLEWFPEGFGSLKKLEVLTLDCLTALTRLPRSVGQLKALKSLKIGHCREFSYLPHGLERMSLLQKVDIRGCPMLSERNRNWPELSHIPFVFINRPRMI